MRPSPSAFPLASRSARSVRSPTSLPSASARTATAADTYNSGLNLELDAILAVVIGGTALAGGRFYLGGSILGALVIQLLTTSLMLRDVNSNLLTLPKAVLVIAVAWASPAPADGLEACAGSPDGKWFVFDAKKHEIVRIVNYE